MFGYLKAYIMNAKISKAQAIRAFDCVDLDKDGNISIREVVSKLITLIL